MNVKGKDSADPKDKDYYRYFPWRAPGYAPVADPCKSPSAAPHATPRHTPPMCAWTHTHTHTHTHTSGRCQPSLCRAVASTAMRGCGCGYGCACAGGVAGGTDPKNGHGGDAVFTTVSSPMLNASMGDLGTHVLPYSPSGTKWMASAMAVQHYHCGSLS